MFANATWLFKNGIVIVEHGEILIEPSGQMLTLSPISAKGIENELQAYFDNYFTMRLENIKVNPNVLGSHVNPRTEKVYETRSTL